MLDWIERHFQCPDCGSWNIGLFGFCFNCAKQSRRPKPAHHHTCQKASKDYRADKEICTCGVEEEPDCQHYGFEYCIGCGKRLDR